MRYVPVDKKGRRKRAKAVTMVHTEAQRDWLLDMAVGAVRSVVRGRGLCLPMSVLLERVLNKVLPEDDFRLRLGSLHVVPLDGALDPIAYDPRGPQGVDGGFHAWVEDRRGELLDPSISITLAADGHPVDDEALLQCNGRTFESLGRRFVYEELDGLELVNLAESEEYLAIALNAAMTGTVPPGVESLVCHLDVAHRSAAVI